MEVTYGGRSTQLDDAQKEYLSKKLSRLSRYLNSARTAHVTHRVVRSQHSVEVQLDLNGVLVRAEEHGNDVSATIDLVTDKLEQQLRKLKDRLRSHKGRADAPTVALAVATLVQDEEPAATSSGNGRTDSVVRRKRVTIKPMTVEEAALQMELLNHDFFAFVNAASGETDVLYRRREGDLGVLELEAG